MNPGHDRDRQLEKLLQRALMRTDAEEVRSENDCLDGETVAAWADGQLKGAQLTSAESHVAGCARCQAVIATVLRTAPEAPSLKPWWRFSAVRWLVPAGAAATAVAIWIALPRDRVESGREADRRITPTVETQKPETIVGRAEPPSPRAEPSSAQEAGAPAPQQGKSDTRLNAQAASETARLQKRVAEPPPAAAAAPAPSSPPPPASPTGAQTASQAERRVSAFADAATPLREGVAAGEIPSSDPDTRWRLSPPDAIERSTDAGATWDRRPLGASLPLTSGSCPASTVCWLVGRAGLVVLTTNGRDFRQVSAPTPADLVSVQASDARTATVTTADSRAFRTDDGGGTWVALNSR